MAYPQTATLLAALRLLQEAILADRVPVQIVEIATDEETHPMPTPEFINDLCNTINDSDVVYLDLDETN